MECGKIRKNLNAYLEGLSSPEEKSALEKHLATCRECSAELEDLKKTIHLVGDMDEIEPPSWLTQKVMTRIRAETAVQESFLTRLFHRYPTGIPAAAVATLVVAVTAVIMMKSMEPEIREPMLPSVAEQPLPPVQKSTPQPAEPEPKKESSTGKTSGGRANPDEEKNLAVYPQAQKNPKKILKEDRVAADGENNIIADSREPGAASSAPAAPAAPSAQKPATALPEPVIAKDEVVIKNAPLQMKRSRYVEKGMEERAAASVVQSYKKVITERHTNGKPYIVVTYRITDDGPNKIMEEKFDETGRRHGLHMAYDDSGKLKVKVWYEHGHISSVKEYDVDGTLHPGESGQDWPWLQINLK